MSALLLALALPLGQAAPAKDDIQDLVYFADERPVLIRLHVRVDGQRFSGAWDRYVEELFTHFDRDGDGVLSKDEAARAPSGQQFQFMRQQGYTYGIGGAATFATFGELDADEDEEVTYAEFLSYYKRTGAAGVQLTFAPPTAAQSDGVGSSLLRLLDRNRDGRLSKDELADAERLLRPFDVNDNQLVSSSELDPAPPVAYTAPAAGMMMRAPPPRRPDAPFALVGADDAANRLTQRLEMASRVLAKYDKDKNGTLSRREIGLEREAFKELDTNSDGELDQVELMKLLRRPPDLEVVVRLGKTTGNETPVDLVARTGLASTAKLGTSGTLHLALGDVEIDLRRAVGSGGDESQQTAMANALRQDYVNRIKMADAKGKGYVERADLQKGQYRRFETLFDLADRDSDGKLTEEELNGWFDLLAKATDSYVTLLVSEDGRGLFDVLDVNRDGSLGLRELRTAWQRLAPFDKKGVGSVALTDIPRQHSLTLGLGQAPLSPRAQAGMPGAETTAVTMRGPVWFRKMDRNGDGDVSLDEFLGTAEEFRKLDADGDGLISVEEAERADATRRRK